MRRTQLYMDEDVWKILQVKAKQTGCTISDLVRQAVREKYAESAERKKQIFESVAGLWANRTDLLETETYVRTLRKGESRKRDLR